MKNVKFLIAASILIISFSLFCSKKSNTQPKNEQPVTTELNFEEHSIDLNFPGIQSILIIDMDGDGDKDIVGGSETTPTSQSRGLAWWRNDGGDPISWHRITVDAGFEHVMSVNVGDIDNDSYPDIIATSWSLHQIAWWKNSGDPTSNWTKTVLRSNFTYAHDARCADIDQDGYTDVAGVSSSGQVIVFYSTGSDPPEWQIRILDSSFAGGKILLILDIDRDGDLDLVGSAADANMIGWWANHGGRQGSWEYHNIGNFVGASGIDVIDMNNDGLYDVIGASWKSDEVSYWICQNLQSDQWQKTVLTEWPCLFLCTQYYLTLIRKM